MSNNEKIIELENNTKLSIIYALSFPEKTSKNKIQKKYSKLLNQKSSRYLPIFNTYKDYFNLYKRYDNRLGELIQSNSKPLIDIIRYKSKISDKIIYKINEILDSNAFRNLNINSTTHYDILNLLGDSATIQFIKNKYIHYKKIKNHNPLKTQKIIIEKSNHFLNELLPYNTYNINIDKDEHKSFRDTLYNLNNDTLHKLSNLSLNHKYLMHTMKNTILWTETINKI